MFSVSHVTDSICTTDSYVCTAVLRHEAAPLTKKQKKQPNSTLTIVNTDKDQGKASVSHFQPENSFVYMSQYRTQSCLCQHVCIDAFRCSHLDQQQIALCLLLHGNFPSLIGYSSTFPVEDSLFCLSTGQRFLCNNKLKVKVRFFFFVF